MFEKKGFTIIELIVSILVFSIAMTGIVLFTSHNSRQSIKSEKLARLSVVSEKTFENFKGILMEETAGGTQLVFDTLWENASVGDTVYITRDTIKGYIIKSSITINEFQFTQDSPVAGGSRMVFLLKTEDLDGSYSDSTLVTFSRHR